jgi:hypothetical protein
VRPPRRWPLDEPQIGPEVARTGSRTLSSSMSIPCEGIAFVVDDEALVTPPEVPRLAESHSGPRVAVATSTNQSCNPPWRAGPVPPPAMAALGGHAPVGRPAKVGPPLLDPATWQVLAALPSPAEAAGTCASGKKGHAPAAG